MEWLLLYLSLRWNKLEYKNHFESYNVNGKTVLAAVRCTSENSFPSLFRLERQKATSRHSKSSQLLSEFVSVLVVQAPTHVGRQGFQNIIQFRLVLR